MICQYWNCTEKARYETRTHIYKDEVLYHCKHHGQHMRDVLTRQYDDVYTNRIKTKVNALLEPLATSLLFIAAWLTGSLSKDKEQ